MGRRWRPGLMPLRARGVFGAFSVNQRLTRSRQTMNGGVHHGMASMPICKKSFAIGALIGLLALGLLRESTEAEHTHRELSNRERSSRAFVRTAPASTSTETLLINCSS